MAVSFTEGALIPSKKRRNFLDEGVQLVEGFPLALRAFRRTQKQWLKKFSGGSETAALAAPGGLALREKPRSFAFWMPSSWRSARSSVQLRDDLAEMEGRARQAVEAGNDEGVAFRTYSRQDFSGGRRSVTLLLSGNHLLAVLEFAELDFEALPDGAHLGVADAHPCWWDGFIIFKAI